MIAAEQPPMPRCRPALAAAHAANPPLATLAGALRAPLVPMIGYAELIAQAEVSATSRSWAEEIVASGRALLAVLDCTLALAAGSAPPPALPEALAAAEDTLAAFQRLLASQVLSTTDGCGTSQRRVA
jgi:hypothetical protein